MEDGDIQVCEMLARYVPVVAVVTKARSDQGFRDEVQRLLPQARNVMRVRALAETDDEGHTLQPRGLTELVDITMERHSTRGRGRTSACSRSHPGAPCR